MWIEADHHVMRSTEMLPYRSIMDCVDQGGFNSVTCRYAFGSQHSGGLNMAFADGSVRLISNTITLTTWQNLGSMADGTAISGGY